MAEKKIELYISRKLKNIDEIVKFTENNKFKFIEPHSEISIKEYAVLILDKKSEGLYSDIIYRSESQFDTIAFFEDGRNNNEDIIKAIDVLKELIQRPGVLNESQIESLTNLDILIYDPKRENIQSASYDLSLSAEHFVSGIKLTKKNKFEIDPLDFVIVRAKESANIPSNICANFDLRVNMFCRGIILSNGPQIDPGYMGRFLCLLFNSSSIQYTMDENKNFCTVVFQSLSSTSKKYSGSYQRKESIGDYVTPYAKETISTNIQRIHGIKKKQDALSQNFELQEKSLEKLTEDGGKLETRLSTIEGRHPFLVSNLGLMFGLIGIGISIFVALVFSGIHSDLGYYKSQIDLMEKEQSILKEKIKDLEKLNAPGCISIKEKGEINPENPERLEESKGNGKMKIEKESTKPIIPKKIEASETLRKE